MRLLILSVFLPLFLEAALVLPTTPKQVAIDWDGMDAYDGDGSAAFVTLGETIQASLSILCSSKQGYTVFVQTANATGDAASVLKNGSYEIPYTVTLDVSGIQNANIRTSQLKLQGNLETLDVKFNGQGYVLPLDGATEANVAVFSFTLASSADELYPQGTYTDTLVATISIQ